MIDEYNIKYIQARLHTERVGWWMRLYQEVGSSNDVARWLAESDGAPDGSVVVAEHQSHGRGRLGRVWSAPPHSSILASFILRPLSLPPERSFALTMCLASAVRATLVGLYPSLKVELKWPNDLMVNEGKVGGILSEVSFTAGVVNWAILGLGLNANVSSADLLGLSSTATSLSVELGRNIDRTAMLSGICDEFEIRYLALQAGAYENLWREWAAHICWYGREVSVSNTEEEVALAGKLLKVETDGALVIQPAHGDAQRIVAGDVSLRLR